MVTATKNIHFKFSFSNKIHIHKPQISSLTCVLRGWRSWFPSCSDCGRNLAAVPELACRRPQPPLSGCHWLAWHPTYSTAGSPDGHKRQKGENLETNRAHSVRTDVRISALASKRTCGVTERAALKQSTALSYSPLRLKRTPRPHCSWGSTWAGSELAACRNRDWTSVNKDLCRKNKKSREAKRMRARRYYSIFQTF